MEKKDKFQKILDNYLGKLYPDFRFVYVQGPRHYTKILKNFYNPTNLIILQIEESLFDDYNKLLEERKKLHNSSIWTEKSFIVTNSKKDYILCKDKFQIVCKPGFFDLLSFSDNVGDNLNIEDISFYTGAAYNNDHIGRSMFIYYMKKFICNDKISFLKFKDKILINNISNSFAFDSVSLAPVPVAYDIWIQKNAFHLAFENNHHGINTDNNFSPTLSEKTFKAMHLMRPCLSFGGNGTRTYLKALGFDTWDWLIDWSFDEETDYEKSLKLFFIELSRLCNIPLYDIKETLQKNKDSLVYNKKHINYLINNYNEITL